MNITTRDGTVRCATPDTRIDTNVPARSAEFPRRHLRRRCGCIEKGPVEPFVLAVLLIRLVERRDEVAEASRRSKLSPLLRRRGGASRRRRRRRTRSGGTLGGWSLSTTAVLALLHRRRTADHLVLEVRQVFPPHDVRMRIFVSVVLLEFREVLVGQRRTLGSIKHSSGFFGSESCRVPKLSRSYYWTTERRHLPEKRKAALERKHHNLCAINMLASNS